jgi:ferredoxin
LFPCDLALINIEAISKPTLSGIQRNMDKTVECKDKLIIIHKTYLKQASLNRETPTMPPNNQPSIFDLMNEESEAVNEEEEKRKRRKELLEPTGVKELYKDGKISINKFTCVGGQCKLCIKKCPTNALYWGTGEVGIIDDLCVYCGACVVNCMVDNCIKIERTRENGETEKFSKLGDVIKLQEKRNSKKRLERVKTNAVIHRRLYKDKKEAPPERKDIPRELLRF